MRNRGSGRRRSGGAGHLDDLREEFRSRTEALVGAEGIAALKEAAVLVCGLGGVGGYVVEALARAGVGRIGLLDGDVVAPSNLNRQILALTDTVGMKKTEAAARRIALINPDCRTDVYDMFYLPDTADSVPLAEYDWVADAVDTVAAKAELICRAKAANVGIVSSMGTGNKLNTSFEICDISETSVCPLARAVRKQLRDRGIERGVDVLYSREEPRVHGSRVPASISYVPAAAGLMIAGHIIRGILSGARKL